METPEFVTLLNEDLETEFRSIVQYVQHIAIIKGAEYMSTVDELKTHVFQELQHALVLAEQVEFLGGTPSVRVEEPPATTDSRRALELDLELERGQLERYRERSAQAADLGLADVAEALRPLLAQTQEHVRDLEAVLGS
ncbi:MAG: ferritin-like domain-containing protein [Acidimicrobiales bacterium]